jgi:hypothetical protein
MTCSVHVKDTFQQHLNRSSQIKHPNDILCERMSSPRDFISGSVFLIFLDFFLLCPIMCLYVPSSEFWCPLRIPHKNDVRFVFPLSFEILIFRKGQPYCATKLSCFGPCLWRTGSGWLQYISLTLATSRLYKRWRWSSCIYHLVLE